jgi:FMN reductase [NAD(P)H]
MNNILETTLNRKTIRNYDKNKLVPNSVIEQIIASVHKAPTSFNAQGLSVISIEDKKIREEVLKLVWNQQQVMDCSHFLIFVMDFNKTAIACEKNGLTQQIHTSVESTIAGSVDVGIAMGTAIALAENMGLGTCCIGAVRYMPKEMSALLKLPQNTFAVAGLCIGYVAQNDTTDIKPKLPMEGYLLKNHYDNNLVKDSIEKYEAIMVEYFKNRGEPEGTNWSGKISSFYAKVYFPDVYPELQKKGFSNNC